VNKLRQLNIDSTWSLFLDRDGVINKKLDNDYVKNVDEFEFVEGAQVSIQKMTKLFGRIGKGIMTHEDLKVVHDYMEEGLKPFDVKFDALYYCPDLAAENTLCRKPNIGMALHAKKDFPEVDFLKSIIVGDSITDIQMGKRAGMKTVFIHEDVANPEEADFVVKSLDEFSILLENS